MFCTFFKNINYSLSVGSCEASHRLFDLPISKSAPAVCRLPVHLENEQQVFFEDGQEEQSLDDIRNTELTAFFSYNNSKKIEQGDAYNPQQMTSYINMCKEYTFSKRQKCWKPRQRNINSSVGRIFRINPMSGDLYYLRLLLNTDFSRGKISFQDLKTVDGVLYENYQQVCRALGLLNDDTEWHSALEQAALTGTVYLP